MLRSPSWGEPGTGESQPRAARGSWRIAVWRYRCPGRGQSCRSFCSVPGVRSCSVNGSPSNCHIASAAWS